MADGFAGVYSLAVSQHQFELFLDNNAGISRSIFFGVQCGPNDVTFRTLVEFVVAPLTIGRIEHGEVCANEWVQHYVPIDAAFVLNGSSASHGRRTVGSSANTTNSADFIPS